ncbi:adenosine deaminase [Planotetraspora phitsanulokensis]|uniref:Adenosine deaminase n=1 Tax=Planotetraspora phitsanulokensis TaxID=575192 RepID=A0A8J3XLN9_9ACTN|nr:adenosine deaminase [Planotetraspora phitsanulokensis]GII40893.1 adenosine deaminase [Planotetraspora phitsanulokensis]
MRDITLLPKAHLHVHLESTIRWETLEEIGAANGVAVPSSGAGGASLAFDGFRQFADHNSLVRDCLRRPEDFRRIAVEFCEDEAAQGTGYAEVTFTAASHGERLGDLEMPLEAVLDGLAEGQAAYGVQCRVVLDHSRRRSVDRAWRTVKLAARHAAVVGVGVAGEESHPLAPFSEVFAAARDAGLHVVHHAGETCGAASIREAIGGGTERLGHGVRVLDDAELVAEVRDRAIPLEVCPSSNVALGVADSLAAHPLPRLRDAGLVVTLNTDIPSIAGTTLSQEYARVRDAFGYGDEVMAEFARASIAASFAPAETKERLTRRVDDWLAAPDS